MKKALSIILSICMLLSIAAGLDFSAYALASSGKCGENVSYTFDYNTGRLIISGYGDMTDYLTDSSPFYFQKAIKEVVINSGVTGIGEWSFYGCSGIKSVSLANTVTHIDYCAFLECTGITELTLPNSVTSIGDSVFGDCSGLTKIFFSNNLTNIGFAAFSGCIGLSSVQFPSSLTTIGCAAFSECKSLKIVTIPKSVKVLEARAFEDCSGLTSVTLENGITSIEARAFYGCSGLSTIDLPNSITRINEWAFSGCIGLKSLTIPSNVTRIDDYAFMSCIGLTNLSIGKNVTYIGHGAFAYCDKLSKISIPKSVAYIGEYSFGGIEGLTSINVDVENTCYCSVNGVLFNKKKTILMQYPASKNNTKYSVPKSVKTITGYAFWGSTKLNNITIYENVKSIGALAFDGCANIKITGYKNSYAQKFASENKIRFIKIKITVPQKLNVIKGKKSFKATWKKVTTIDGYQVQYSTDKKFKKGNKTVTIKKQATTSTTVKKLKAKKKYYVRIRAYKTINGKKQYSSWSKSKTVTTKK